MVRGRPMRYGSTSSLLQPQKLPYLMPWQKQFNKCLILSLSASTFPVVMSIIIVKNIFGSLIIFNVFGMFLSQGSVVTLFRC